MNNIYSEFLNAKLNFDRVVTDTFELPYKWDTIEIQPNEIATSNSFNLKIKKLYSNLLYLYGLCNISDYKIPKNYTGVIGVSTSKSDILSSRTITLSGGLFFSTGNNDRGQLGGGTGITESSYSSFQIPTNLKFDKVVCGSNFAFGLTANTLYAVGDNGYGQLGISDSTVLSSSEWFQLTGRWLDVACGDFHTLALSSGGPNDRLLFGCGRNSNNQLGDPNFATSTYTFLSLGSTFNFIFAGPATSFALTANRSNGLNLYGAGNASSYQFGDGNNNSFTTWRTITGDWAKVAPGESHTVFLSTTKLVYVAGDNTYGQLGVPLSVPNATFSRLILSGVYDDITVGSNHTFLLSGTRLFSSGLNDRGQLGLGIATDSAPFSAVQGRFLSVKAKSNNTYALSTNDLTSTNVYYSILACGDNVYGQLGANYNLPFSNVFLPASGGDYVDVYPGGNFAFALSGNKQTTTTTLSSLSTYILNNFYYSPDLITVVPFISSYTAFGVSNSFDAVTFLPKNSEYTTILLVLSRDYITLIGIDVENKPKELGFFNLINPVSGTLFIENLKSGVTDGEKYFYFTDNIYNNVFYFDLEGFYSNRTFRNKQYLVETLAGFGGRYDNIKLNNPGQLAFTGEKLIVEDTGNQAFKVYDRNLNWLATSTPISIFREITSFNTMEFNKVQNKLYACSDKKMFVFNFQNNNTLLSSNSIDFSNLLSPGETIKKIKFSSYDSEIYFLLTDKKLIKRWTTKDNANIGIYLNTTDFNGFNFRWLTTSPSQSNSLEDSLFVYCNTPSSSANFIATYRDDYDLITILKNKDINIYTEEDLYIDPDEYNASWVYNKSFKKMLYNMVLFNSSIIYRFVQNADVYNTPVLVDRVYNSTFLDKAKININKYALIGINENFQAATLNRCLKLIYDYQQDLLDSVVSNDNITINLSPGRLRKTNPYNLVIEQLNLGTEDLLSLLTEFGIYLINE